MRHDHAAIALLQLAVRNGEHIRISDDRLAGSGPQAAERQREVRIVLAGQELFGVEPEAFVEERGLEVVDVDDQRPIPELLGEHADTEAGKRGLET